jgi:integrase/recombinase XerD
MAYKMTNLKRKNEEKTLDKIFDEYITNCKLRGLSGTTIKEYQKTYKYYIQSKLTLTKELNKSFCEKFILELKEKNYTATSINTVIVRLKAFTNWMFKNSYIKKLEISKLKEEDNIKEPYTQEELKILLKKPNMKKCGFKEYRTLVLICTALSTGLRRTSIANLKLEDIDF